jgi:cell division protein FtsN
MLPAALALVGLIAAAVLIVMPRVRGSAPRNVATTSTPSAIRAATASRRSAPKRSPKTSSRASLAPKPTVPSARAARPPATRERFGIDVGTYSDAYWAEGERDRIVSATHLKGWVIADSLDGGDTYHVVLGVYRTRERARSAADVLTGKGVVTEATVVPAPPKHLRR